MVDRAGPDAFDERFPASQLIARQQWDDDAAALKALAESAQARWAAATDAEARVLEAGDAPVGLIAEATGRSLAEIWAQLRPLPIGYPGEPVDAEVVTARDALGSGAVFEMGALHSLHAVGVGVADVVLRELPMSVYTPATATDLIQATMPDLSGGQETVQQLRWDAQKGEMITVEMSAQEARQPVAVAESIQGLLGRLQTPPPQPPVQRSGTHSQIALAYAELTELAGLTGFPIYTDDRFLRRLLATLAIPAFGTVALLQALNADGSIGADAVAEAFSRLRDRGAIGVPEVAA